jgi:hypothetical protein
MRSTLSMFNVHPSVGQPGFRSRVEHLRELLGNRAPGGRMSDDARKLPSSRVNSARPIAIALGDIPPLESKRPIDSRTWAGMQLAVAAHHTGETASQSRSPIMG